jgi:hypothetical protein
MKNSTLPNTVPGTFEAIAAGQRYKGASISTYNPQTMIMDVTVPKHYAYDFSSDKYEIESVAHFLDDSKVVAILTTTLCDSSFLESYLTKLLSARSGMIKTSHALLTFDLLITRTAEILADHGHAVSEKTATVVASLFVDLLGKLNLMLVSGKVRTFETHASLIPTSSDLISELRKMHIRSALEDMDMGKLNISKEVSIAALINVLQPMFIKFSRSLVKVGDVDRAFNDVMALMKAFIIKDYTQITLDERYIFEENDFLELTTNLTLAKFALASPALRPKSGEMYWTRMVEKLSSLLRSSSRYNVVELRAFKEWFTSTVIYDKTGFKRGIILSKNLAERQNLQIFHKMSENKKNDVTRLVEDHSAVLAFDGIFNTASSLTSKSVHDFLVSIATLTTTSDTEFFYYGSNVASDETMYLAAAQDQLLDIVEDSVSKRVIFTYRIDETDSKIDTGSSTLASLTKTPDPRLAMLYSMSDFEGKQTFSFEGNPVAETLGYTFIGSKDIFTSNLSRSLDVSLAVAGQTIKTNWSLENLSGIHGLENTVAVFPAIGKHIISSLFQAYSSLLEWSIQAGDINKTAFETNVTIALTNVLHPILATRDVDDMLSSAISLMWSDLTSSLSPDSKKFSIARSSFGDLALRAELKVRLSLFLLLRLGFISSDKDDGLAEMQRVVSLFKSSGAFNVISLTNRSF